MPGVEDKALPAYVDARRSSPPQNKALKAINAADESPSFEAKLAALAGLDTTGPKLWSIEVLSQRGNALRSLRRKQEAYQAFFDAGVLAQKIGWLRRASMHFNASCKVASSALAWKRARAAAERMLSVDEARGDPARVGVTLHQLGHYHTQLGDSRQALVALTRALELHDTPSKIAITESAIAMAHITLRRFEEASVHLAHGLKMAEKAGDDRALNSLLMAQVRLYGTTGRHREALASAQRGLAVAEKRGSVADMAQQLRNIASLHMVSQDFPKAIATYERALEIARTARDLGLTADLLQLLGNAHCQIGNFDAATTTLSESVAILERTDARFSLSNAYANLAKLLRDREDYQGCETYMRKALKLSEALGDEAGIAYALGGIGDVRGILGSVTEALGYQERSLAILEKIGSPRQLVGRLSSIGSVHLKRGDKTNARAAYERGLKIAKTMKSPRDVALMEYCLATTYTGTKSVELLKRVLKTYRRLGLRPSVATVFHALALNYVYLTDYDRASACAQRSLKLAKALGLRGLEARCFLVQSSVHDARGEMRECLDCAKRALALAESTKDADNMASAIEQLTHAYLATGDSARAEECIERFAKMPRELDRAARGLRLKHLGELQSSRGKPRAAIASYKRAMEVARALDRPYVVAYLHGAIGSCYRDFGANAKALESMHRSWKQFEELGDRRSVGGAQFSIGQLYRLLGDSERALGHFERCLEIGAQISSSPTIADALSALAPTCMSRGEHDKALGYAKRALALAEESGAPLAVEGKLMSLARISMALGNSAEAIASCERARKLAEKHGHQLNRAEAQIQLGAFYGRLGDHEAAIAELENARAIAQQNGLTRSRVHALSRLAQTYHALKRPREAARAARLGVEGLPTIVSGLAQEQGALARSSWSSLFGFGAAASVARKDASEALYFMESSRAGTLLEALGGRSKLTKQVLPPELRDAVNAARAEARGAQVEL